MVKAATAVLYVLQFYEHDLARMAARAASGTLAGTTVPSFEW
ncbi:hypothetical protein [Microvirga arabica]|nr:hypothetical protein [Microvirga arabica]